MQQPLVYPKTEINVSSNSEFPNPMPTNIGESYYQLDLCLQWVGFADGGPGKDQLTTGP